MDIYLHSALHLLHQLIWCRQMDGEFDLCSHKIPPCITGAKQWKADKAAQHFTQHWIKNETKAILIILMGM